MISLEVAHIVPFALGDATVREGWVEVQETERRIELVLQNPVWDYDPHSPPGHKPRRKRRAAWDERTHGSRGARMGHRNGGGKRRLLPLVKPPRRRIYVQQPRVGDDDRTQLRFLDRVWRPTRPPPRPALCARCMLWAHLGCGRVPNKRFEHDADTAGPVSRSHTPPTGPAAGDFVIAEFKIRTAD